MVDIDRSNFARDERLDGLSGRVVIQGRSFDVFVKSWDGDLEAAWAMASRAADLFLNRFGEIKTVIGSKLSPELDHWTCEPLTNEQITESVIAAIQGTERISLNASERSAELYADGPPLVLGHGIEVCLAKDGTLFVGLAG